MAAESTDRRAGSFRSTLKQSTQELHAALDRHPVVRRMTSPLGTLSDYARVLSSFATVYGSLEPAIERGISVHALDFDYSKRRKLPWLLADLDHLAACDDQLRPGQVGKEPVRGTAVPAMRRRGDVLGALYPVEGSTLGGQLIARQLVRQHRLSADRGARFFHGYGADTGRRWSAFLDLLESHAHCPETVAQACDSAIRVFHFFSRSLDSHAR